MNGPHPTAPATRRETGDAPVVSKHIFEGGSGKGRGRRPGISQSPRASGLIGQVNGHRARGGLRAARKGKRGKESESEKFKFKRLRLGAFFQLKLAS